MKSLLNIDRPEGFPLCAETLSVLNENSMMLLALLAEIPIDRRQAVMFGRYLLVCDQYLRKRIVEVGAINAASLEQCKLVFQTVNHSVYNNQGNEIADVWSSEMAVIEDEDSPGLQWRIFSLDEVFTLGLWQDRLPAFVAGLSGCAVSDGSIAVTRMYGDGNILRANANCLQMKLAITGNLTARSNDTVLSIPFPTECPDGTRQEVDLQIESSEYHYSARSYFRNGMLRVNIGSWLKDFIKWQPSQSDPTWTRNIIIRINREVIL